MFDEKTEKCSAEKLFGNSITLLGIDLEGLFDWYCVINIFARARKAFPLDTPHTRLNARNADRLCIATAVTM